MAIKYYEKMPVVPLRGLVVMPYTLLSFDAGRDKSVAAIETAAENDGLVFLTAQKDPKLTDITAKQLFVRNVFQILDHAPQCVAVGYDQDIVQRP